MTHPATSAGLDDFAGDLHALTAAVARLRPQDAAGDVAVSGCHLALLAARADLDDVLPGLPPPVPAATGGPNQMAARLRTLGGHLSAWSRANTGEPALATARASLKVDEAADNLDRVGR